MASLLERIQNVFDNHQDFERQQARQEGYSAALRDTRDELLSSAVAIHRQWCEEIQRTEPGWKQEAIHGKYAARLYGLNDAFAALRQGDPGITTQLDVEQFKQNVMERASHQRQELSLAHSRIERGYEYSISH